MGLKISWLLTFSPSQSPSKTSTSKLSDSLPMQKVIGSKIAPPFGSTKIKVWESPPMPHIFEPVTVIVCEPKVSKVTGGGFSHMNYMDYFGLNEDETNEATEQEVENQKN